MEKVNFVVITMCVTISAQMFSFSSLVFPELFRPICSASVK